MMCQKFILIALLSVIAYLSIAEAQDILFPGETERPLRFPIKPTQPTKQVNNNNQNQGVPPLGSNANNGQTVPSQQVFNACVDQCKRTAEYNPVCGTDGTVYYNPGSLGCAQTCGSSVQFVRYGQCDNVIKG